jgi:hypothetical protein
VVDEVQRAPALLDEVHYLMEAQGHKRFVLTGSTAQARAGCGQSSGGPSDLEVAVPAHDGGDGSERSHRSPDPIRSVAVDFVFWRGKRMVAIEVKHGRTYRTEYRKGIAALLETMRAESYVVYRGRELVVDGTRVLPCRSSCSVCTQETCSGDGPPDVSIQ